MKFHSASPNEAVFPKAMIQTCIVRLFRNSLNYVAWKDRKLFVAHLKPDYEAGSEEVAESQHSRRLSKAHMASNARPLRSLGNASGREAPLKT